MTAERRLQIALLLLRLGVFIVMLAWTLDKFINPAHAAGVFERFYFISGIGAMIMTVIAISELLIVLAFVLGLWKFYTYGFVLVVHGVSTLSSWKQYTVDINLLFFAAWPMLAACAALFLLRDLDTLCTINTSARKSSKENIK